MTKPKAAANLPKTDEIEDATIVPEQPVAPTLDLQDLAMALNLINVAIKRGTYETAELRGVLDVFEKLEVFLKFQAESQAAAQEKTGEDNGST